MLKLELSEDLTIAPLERYLPEKSVTKIFTNGKIHQLENIPRDVTPTVMGCWPLLFYHTFLNLQSKYDISFLEVGSQVQIVISKKHNKLKKILSREIIPRATGPWPLFR